MPIDTREWLADSFGIGKRASEHSIRSVPAAELLHVPLLREWIDEITVSIRGQDRTAAAVRIAGSFGGVALALQAALSVRDTAPDLCLPNLAADLNSGSGKLKVEFRPVTWSETPAPAGPSVVHARPEWRDTALRSFYGHARPLIEALAEAGGVNAGLLWGQWPARLHNAISQLMLETDNSLLRRQLEEDYLFLRSGLPPREIFGRARNPFDVPVKPVEDLTDPGRQVALKSSCCLNYRTEGGVYCYRCPRLTEAERAERRKSYRLKAGIAEA